MFIVRNEFLRSICRINRKHYPASDAYPARVSCELANRPPHKYKLLFESLEPRLLLSSDINPASAIYEPAHESSNAQVIVNGTHEGVTIRLDSSATNSQTESGTSPPPPGESSLLITSTNQLSLAAISIVQAHWIGGTGNWSEASNWDIGLVPNNTEQTQYDVVLDVSGEQTVTLDQDAVIKSLNNAETLVVAGRKLSISQQTTNSGTIQLTGDTAQLSLAGTVNITGSLDAGNGTLNLSNATVTVEGAAAFIGADHIATLSNASLYAKNGGVMSLLGATAYTSASGGNTIQASGTGSRIDLSALTSFAGGSSGSTQIKALSGGALALSGAVTGYTNWTLDATGGAMDVAGVTSLTGATVNVSGGAVLEFSGATNIAQSSLYASDGGNILFPMAVGYTGYNYGDTTIQASGAGSRIDLSNLSSLAGGGGHTLNPYQYVSYWTRINALSGGEVDLGGALSVNTGNYGNYITMDGSASLINLEAVINARNTIFTVTNNATWTFPPTWHPTWLSGNTLTTDDTSQFINTGTLVISSNTLTVNTSAFTNEGILSPLSGGVLDFNNGLQVNSSGILAGVSGGSFNIAGNLLGDTRNADLYAPKATVRFDGAGTVVSPQRVEVMGRDVGAVAAGFSDNFVYANITLGGNTYVTLVDLSDNAAGSEPEALYTNALIIPAGSALNLNGLHLYTRAAVIEGVVVNGSIDLIPDSGALEFASPTPGKIAVAGEVDEWTFFARAGQHISAVVDSGSGAVLTPKLNWAQIDVLDAEGNTLATRSSTASGQTLSLDDVTIPADGNYRIRVKAPAGHLTATGNYQVSVWNVTADVSDLLLNKQVVGQIENPYAVDRWNFSANAGTQIRFDLVNRASSGIVFDLVGPAGWSAFTNQSADSDLITLPTDGNYTLTAHSTGGQQGGAYAFKLDQTQVIDLTMNTPYSGQFVGSGQAQLFRVHVSSTDSLRVVLDDSAGNNANEVYLKFGSAPTRGDYEYRYVDLASSDQTVTVPRAFVGDWYVLLYSDVVSTQSGFTLTALPTPITITALTPDHYAATADAQLTIYGSGFTVGDTVELRAADGTLYAANSVEVDSFTQIRATFTANSVPPDWDHPYDLVVGKPGSESTILEGAFLMKPSGEAHLVTNMVVPSQVGYHQPATIWVEYSNDGDVAMSAPLLVVSAKQGEWQGAKLILPTLAPVSDLAVLNQPFTYQPMSQRAFWTSSMPNGYANTVQFLASGVTPGVLQPGESVRVPVQYAGWEQPWDFSYRSITFTLGVVDANNTTALDWSAVKDDMRPDSISTDAWNALWGNFTAQAGETWGEYLTMLTDNAIYLGGLAIRENDIGNLLAFEFAQADALNVVSTLGGATDAAVSQPGLDLVFSRVFPENIIGRYRLDDLGYGWSNNWDYQLTEVTTGDYAGTIRITGPGGSTRTFQPDSRPGRPYFSMEGDYGTLTRLSASEFQLRESSGLLKMFVDGRLSYVEDSNGNRITCTYTDGRLTALTHSSGGGIEIAYNASGYVSSLTDSLGRVTTYAYSGSDLASVTYYDGSTVGYTYAHGQGATREHALTGITTPGGYHEYFSYGADGRLTSVDGDATTHWAGFSYGTAGQVYVSDALGDTSSYFLDDNGALIKATNALGNSVSLEYDVNDNLTRIFDPAGAFNQYVYDSRGNVSNWVDANGNSTRFSYTSNYNQLSRLTDANGNITL